MILFFLIVLILSNREFSNTSTRKTRTSEIIIIMQIHIHVVLSYVYSDEDDNIIFEFGTENISTLIL